MFEESTRVDDYSRGGRGIEHDNFSLIISQSHDKESQHLETKNKKDCFAE